jgi:hypothetical protein
MSRRIVKLGSTVFLLAASCASTQPGTKRVGTIPAAEFKSRDGTPVATVGPAPKGKIICSMEIPVGTHIPERVCRYEDDADSIRDETQQMLRNATQPKQTIITGG